jgi:ATP-binding cassette subfamily B protein
MSFRDKLNQGDELALRGRMAEGEAIEYVFTFDLNERENFVDGKLVICREKLYVVAEGEVWTERRIDAGKDYKMRENGNTGYLEYTDILIGAERVLVYFSLGGLKRFGYAESILNAFSEGKDVTIYDKEAMYSECRDCGTKFIHNTRTCPKCNNKFGLIKRLLMSTRQTWPLYGAILFIILIASLVSLLNPFIYRNMIDTAIQPMADGTREAALRPLVMFALLLAGVSILRVLLNIVRMFISAQAGGMMSRNFRTVVYGKISQLSVKFLDTKQAGDLMNRVNNDTDRIREFMNGQMVPFINELFIMFSVMVAILIFDWRLGLVILAPMPLIVLFMSRVNFRRRYHAQWVKMDKLNSTLNNILSGIRVVKAFGQEKREIERFCNDAATVRDITAKNDKFWFTLFPLIQFAMGVGNYFVLLYCGTQIINMRMTIGELVQFSTYAQMMYGRLDFFTRLPRHISDAANAANRIYEVIDEDIELRDEASLERPIDGAVDVEGMTFGYLSYKPVLKDLNLNIKQGEMIGIVGHSGAGKSTFINLIMRLYDADEGSISVDGYDLRELSVRAYKNQIGVVLQEPFLFSGTVRENILYSKPEATFEEIIKAAKIANAHDFITKLPNGYDTRVGEKGHSLSGGERQRVSIARAVLNDPRILILDEATASVDTETEAAIQEAFARLIKGRTTFAIAHRLSTLKNADRIMVIDKGELKEFGSHGELMEIPEGIYHGLVMAQRRMSRVKAIQM